MTWTIHFCNGLGKHINVRSIMRSSKPFGLMPSHHDPTYIYTHTYARICVYIERITYPSRKQEACLIRELWGFSLRICECEWRAPASRRPRRKKVSSGSVLIIMGVREESRKVVRVQQVAFGSSSEPFHWSQWQERLPYTCLSRCCPAEGCLASW